MLRRLVAAALVVLVGFAAHLGDILRPVEDWLTAARMELAPRAATGQVVLVDIDSRSIAAIGQWPWPRRLHAQMIDGLVAAGAAEIGIDIDFSAHSNPEDDKALADAIGRADGRVILAAFAQHATAAADAPVVLNRPIPEIAAAAWLASVNVSEDADGRVRAFPGGLIADREILPSLPAFLAGGVSDAGGRMLVDFSIDPGSIDRISAIDLLQGNVAAQRLAGRKVILGSAAVELRDFFLVPVTGTVSGPMLQALATETLLQGRHLRPSSEAVSYAGLFLIGLTAFAIGRVRWARALVAIGAASLAIEGGALIAFAAEGVVVDTIDWQAGLAVLVVTIVVSEIDLRQIVQAVWRLRARRAEAILSRVVADNSAGIVVVDFGGRVTAASRAAAHILGRSAGLEGEVAADVLPPGLADPVAAALAGRVEPLGGEEKFVIGGEERVLDYVVTLSLVGDEDGATHGDRAVACLTFTDITARRAAEARIRFLARFDALTDLPNRNQLVERLSACEHGRAVVSFNIDGFKNVNDTLGHAVGDRLLRSVAERAAALLPPDACVARLGGDEFAAVFADGPADANAAALAYAKALLAQLRDPFLIEQHRLVITASAGVALTPDCAGSADDALRHADVALAKAKGAGGNCFAVFSGDMLEEVARRRRLEFDLQQAVDRRQFEVWYQPQYDLEGGSLVGAEALIRWHHPERGVISPAEFVPVAEATGLIEMLGSWVLDTACRDAAGWHGDIKVAVNVSSSQFTRSDMAASVAAALARTGLPASRLEIEITESLFMQPGTATEATLARLRATGVAIALDDFGTGYSSFSYIHRFPIDKIKIDQSFVAGLPVHAGSTAIVSAIAALAQNLGIRLNAEGIETPEQASFLRLLGVREGQGYLLGRPLPSAAIAHLVANGRRQPVRLSA